jgi:hypothetical protein
LALKRPASAPGVHGLCDRNSPRHRTVRAIVAPTFLDALHGIAARALAQQALADLQRQDGRFEPIGARAA